MFPINIAEIIQNRQVCCSSDIGKADFGSGAGSGFVGVDIVAADAEEEASTVSVGTGSADGTRKEGAAYVMGGDDGAITAGYEQATIIWKFY